MNTGGPKWEKTPLGQFGEQQSNKVGDDDSRHQPDPAESDALRAALAELEENFVPTEKETVEILVDNSKVAITTTEEPRVFTATVDTYTFEVKLDQDNQIERVTNTTSRTDLDTGDVEAEKVKKAMAEFIASLQ